MKLAMVAAKFTPEQANGLRRAMATFRNLGTIDRFRTKFVGGMTARGYTQEFAERFNGLDQDPATRKLIAAAVAAEQVLDLVDQGVTNFHFYTMNRADLVYAICHLLGLRPAVEQAA